MEINIPELIMKSHEPKEVVAFLTSKIRNLNRREDGLHSAELELYVEILEALNKRMGGGAGKKIL